MLDYELIDALYKRSIIFNRTFNGFENEGRIVDRATLLKESDFVMY